MKKKYNKQCESAKEYDDFVLKMSLALLKDAKTNAIVVPYLQSMTVDEAKNNLKCIAGLLLVDDDKREKICKETLGNLADFILMMVRELDRIIAEEVK